MRNWKTAFEHISAAGKSLSMYLGQGFLCMVSALIWGNAELENSICTYQCSREIAVQHLGQGFLCMVSALIWGNAKLEKEKK